MNIERALQIYRKVASGGFFQSQEVMDIPDETHEERIEIVAAWSAANNDDGYTGAIHNLIKKLEKQNMEESACEI